MSFPLLGNKEQVLVVNISIYLLKGNGAIYSGKK